MLVNKFDSKMDIGYFIEYCKIYRSYLKSLEQDHEPDEIKTQMRYYRKIMHNKADLYKWEHP